MKKHFITIIFIITLLIGGVSVFPHHAHAGWIEFIACGMGNPEACFRMASESFFNNVLADMGNSLLAICSWILTASAIVLNVAIVLTMNIKAIYNATPAIEQIWLVIRNLSSIFIIFGLVYASIAKILDIGGPNLGKMIKNIVIAGLLINFSLFFTRIFIDTSNLISIQFYRAIAPTFQNVNIENKAGLTGLLGSAFNDGGISNVFMQSLKIPKIYDRDSKALFNQEQEGGTAFKTIISTFAGSALMIVASLSFFAAGIAFIVRLVILLLLMGFSPVFFVGMIFPDIQKNLSGKWMGYLEQQLVFMPVYLLFMYVALRFINGATPDEGFFSALDAATNRAKGAENGVLLSTIGLIIQYMIAFILINIPLIAAQQTGGLSVKWGTSAKDWVAGKIGKGTKSGFAFGAQHTVGRGASALRDTIASSNLARRNPNLALFADKALGKASSGTFGGSKGGYDKRFKEYAKERTDYGDKKIGLNSTEKAAVKTSLDLKVMEWDTETQKMKTEYEKKKREYEEISEEIGPNTSKAQAAKEQMDKAKKAYEERTPDKRTAYEKEQKGKIEGAAKANAKTKYAEALAGSKNVVTSEADKKAAKDLLEKLSKGKDKKALDALSDWISETGGGDKPKEGGEDK